MIPPSAHSGDTPDPAMLEAVARAVDPGLSERPSEWVLVAGSLDHQVRSLFSRARVVMWDGASALRLPRESFQSGLWLADAGPLTSALGTLVQIRNALRHEAVLIVAAGSERLAQIQELAGTAGLSRSVVRAQASSFGVLELRR